MQRIILVDCFLRLPHPRSQL